MHLLATEPGIIADGSAAVDLAQTPGDIVVLASADTEIALLAAAQARRRAEDPAAPSLRLAPVMRLGHNFSVDLYMEVVAQARLVVARLLGGSGYWPYGVERLAETCRAHGIPLALLPGDDKPDAELARLSTLPAAGVPPAVALSRGRRPGQRRQFPALRRQPDRAAPHARPSPPQRGEGSSEAAFPLPARGERDRVRGDALADWAEPAPLLRAGLYWPILPPASTRSPPLDRRRRRRADRVLPGAGAVGKHRAGRCAGAGAGRAPAAAVAGVRAQP